MFGTEFSSRVSGPCEGVSRIAGTSRQGQEGDPWYMIAFDHRPTEEEVREYWEKKRSEQSTTPP